MDWKWLITGGLGFIGSTFVEWLVGTGLNPEQILILDKCTYAARDPEDFMKVSELGKVMFKQMDIIDLEQKDLVLDSGEIFRPDIIVHFAAETHVDNSITEPEVFLQTNILGTSQVAKYAEFCGAYLVHISTDEVYGEISFFEPEGVFTESTPRKPHSPYSASKAAAEMIVEARSRTYGLLNYLIVRPCNMFGKYQHGEKMIPTVIRHLALRKPVPVYGLGKNVREWMWTVDFCNVLVNLIFFTSRTRQIYNIGSGLRLTNIALVRTISEVMGIVQAPVEYVPDRPGHDQKYALDSSRMMTVLEESRLSLPSCTSLDKMKIVLKEVVQEATQRKKDRPGPAKG
jgi:dTDP-glucose 4,6-dehydratase